MDETYVVSLLRVVVDQYGQVIDVLVSTHRDGATAQRFFQQALTSFKVIPGEAVTDAAPIYPAVLEELTPAAWHHVERHASNGSRLITAN